MDNTQIEALDNLPEARDAAEAMGLKFSGNTGLDTLKAKMLASLEGPEDSDPLGDNEPMEEIQIAKKPAGGKLSIAQLMKMDANKEEDPMIRRRIVRAKALRLSRVRIVNMDPTDAAVPGMLLSVQNKYTGKVQKYIPFGEESENGYHVPEILLDWLRAQTYALRKEIKGGKIGIKQYKTTQVKKFTIEILDPLTKDELAAMALRQAAAGAIDN
tara:strand:- start:2824 stop:3465 length:642 start_codon:yes stop_codon:yes gene_type:complete